MSTPDDAAIRISAAYAAAVYDRDVAAFMRLYDPSARVFDTWATWSYEDAAARHGSIAGWLGSLGDERVRVTFSDLRSSGSADLVAVSAVVTYAAWSAAGVELRSMQNRLSWVLERSGSELLIVHEHTSVPIGDQDLKGILQRPLA